MKLYLIAKLNDQDENQNLIVAAYTDAELASDFIVRNPSYSIIIKDTDPSLSNVKEVECHQRWINLETGECKGECEVSIPLTINGESKDGVVKVWFSQVPLTPITPFIFALGYGQVDRTDHALLTAGAKWKRNNMVWKPEFGFDHIFQLEPFETINYEA